MAAVDARTQLLQLAWNPLAFVLAQVVISPVLRMEEYVPDLQELLRKNGYPSFHQRETQTVTIGSNKSPDIQSETHWVFSNREKTHSVILSTGFLVFEVSNYTTFETFIDNFRGALEALQEVVGVGLYQRLGFRRINLLEGSPKLPLDAIVKPNLLGLEGAVFEAAHEQRLEHWGDTNVGRLMVRLLRPAPRTVVPTDIDATGLNIRMPRVDGRDTATLDIDHFLHQEDEFVPETIIERFWSLHHPSDLAFHESVTQEALDAWKNGDPTDGV